MTLTAPSAHPAAVTIGSAAWNAKNSPATVGRAGRRGSDNRRVTLCTSGDVTAIAHSPVSAVPAPARTSSSPRVRIAMGTARRRAVKAASRSSVFRVAAKGITSIIGDPSACAGPVSLRSLALHQARPHDWPVPPMARRPDSPEDEGALIDALPRRREAAFAALVGGFAGPMLRLARIYARSVAVAEEVVQEA